MRRRTGGILLCDVTTAYRDLMYRWLLVTVVALSPMLLATPASACSAGPAFDARAETRVLVIGRITRIELVQSEMQPPKGSTVWYRKLVTIQVTQVYKGAPPDTLRFWDTGPAQYFTGPDGQQTILWGGGGDCSAITDDVTGRYMAVALGGPAHELWANALFGSLVMTGPADPRVADLLTRHGFTLPATSTR